MPATQVTDISRYRDDAYLSDWYHGYHEQGIKSPVEQANAALMRADLAAAIVGERGDDLDKAQAESVCERVALAASACAKAERTGRPELAKEFAKFAQSEVLILTAFDYVNISA